MAMFYFHIMDGGLVDEDCDGFDFLTAEAASQEAVRAAREMALELIGKNEPLGNKAFVVENADHSLLVTVPFTSVISIN